MKNLVELDKRHFIHPTSSIKQQQEDGPKAIFTKGEGIYLTDTEGKTYIDAMSSLWNVNVGHGRKELAEVAAKQMETLAFSSAFSTFSNEPAILLAEKIASMTPGDLNRIFFTSGGSESNDTAIKLVRHYWKIQGKPERRKILSRKRAYHGVAAASTSATGIPQFWDMAGDYRDDYIHVDPPYHRSTEEAIKSMREAIEREGAETIAAFFAEPVMGAGGVIVPPDDYFKEVRKVCDEYGIIFVADEVITGYGRTGEMFAIEKHYGVIPDMMTFAKGVTSGYIQLGGVAVSDKMFEVLHEKSEGVMFHGFTYSGHPTACAVGLKNIEIIEREGLVENSREMGKYLLERFEELKSQIDIIGEVRGKGLMAAVEFVKDRETYERFDPALMVSPRISEEFHQRGVIARPVTYEGTDIITFSPPLIMNKEQIDTMVEKFYDAIKAVENTL